MDREKAIKDFYAIYIPMKHKYGLLLHVSINKEAEIEIYRIEGKKKKYIIKIKGEEEEEIYVRAAEELKRFGRRQEEKWQDLRKSLDSRMSLIAGSIT